MRTTTTYAVDLPLPDKTAMRCVVAQPEGEAPRRGLILCPEAFGVNDYIRDVAQRFAREGYLVIAPELFHRSAPAGFEASYTDLGAIKPHLEALTLEGQRTDLAAAHAWLLAQEGIQQEWISAVGFCMGGRTAFIANALLPLRRAVSFYGGRIHEIVDRAPQLHGPMLLLWGGKDQRILPEHRRAVLDALQASGKDFVHTVYSFADHGFFCDRRASYNARASALAWPTVLAFLE